MNIKIFLALCASVLFLLSVPGVYAQGIIDPLNTGDMASPIKNVGQGYELLVTIVQWMYTIFFVVAVLFILLAAYNFIIGGSGGQNEAKIKTAKSQLKYAVIAIAIALVASGMAALIKGFLENPSDGAQPAQPNQSVNSSAPSFL